MSKDKPELTIRYARPKDRASLTDFRISQFKTAKQFEILDLEALAKQRGAIYLVELNGRLVSTMQFEVVSNLETLKTLTNTLIPPEFSAYKTVYLSKAATSVEFRKIGLNSLLRSLAIRSLGQDPSIKSFTGVAVQHASRLNVIKRIGYTLRNTDPLDTKYAIPKGDVYFLELARDKFETALSILDEDLNRIRQVYEVNIQTE